MDDYKPWLPENAHPGDIQWLINHNMNGDVVPQIKRVEASQPYVPIAHVPAFTVRALNRHGYDVTMDAIYWANKIGLTVDPEYIRPLMIKSGAWSVTEVMGYTDDALAGIVLWLACREFFMLHEQGHRPPYTQVYDIRLHTV